MDEQDGKNEMNVTRYFDAPCEVVWQAWTDPRHLPKWFGPKDVPTKVVSFDLRPGGTFHYLMQSPDGGGMFGKFVYEEIVAPERLVYISSFSDEDANVARAPFSEHFPLEIRNIVTLSEKNGRTLQVLRARPHNASDEEWDVFRGMLDNVTKSFGATMDQLEAYLAKLSESEDSSAA